MAQWKMENDAHIAKEFGDERQFGGDGDPDEGPTVGDYLSSMIANGPTVASW